VKRRGLHRRGRALRRRYGRSEGAGKRLNVVRRGDRWAVTGLTSGEDIPLHLHLSYPETEWPEIGSIKGAETMLKALYDIWQWNDELEEAAEEHGGVLRFHTPYGDFETVGFGVVPTEKAPAARAALALYEERGAKIQEIENAVMEREGFGSARMDEILAQYGGRFDDWPQDLRRAHGIAMGKAFEAAEPIRALLRVNAPRGPEE
jgi:hypothetical protein